MQIGFLDKKARVTYGLFFLYLNILRLPGRFKHVRF
uniref:Uncharacterized protein n=1 Tax=virus sp. ct1Hk25 TaxID=2825803 RepID=A0A8S5RNR5_9VIRU|nr:MAG TPA: hypothetical protein [virus sp. ct1Hk25]